jgi:hypothetical protein
MSRNPESKNPEPKNPETKKSGKIKLEKSGKKI